MQLAILTRDSEVPSTVRLCQAATALGIEVKLLPILRTSLLLASGAWGDAADGNAARSDDIKGDKVGSGVGSHNAVSRWDPVTQSRSSLGPVDAVIARIGTVFPQHALAILRQLEAQGCWSLNSSAAIAAAASKIDTLSLAHAAGLPIPRTVLVKDLDQLPWAIEAVGGAPVVIKPSHGLQGRRVVLAESVDAATSVAEAFLLFNQEVIVQQFVAEAAGQDLRVWVLGGEVVAAMQRQAPAGTFRANVHRGGEVKVAVVSDEVAGIAVAAARSVGLRWAGVDVILSARGPLLLEVNASPGLEGIERATQRDLATEVIDYLRVQCRRKDGGEDA